MTNKPLVEHRQLIAALLGSAEPELTCEECFEQLDRYVDLQLTAADADRAVPGMRAHLIGCPACRDDHASLRELVATEDQLSAP
jgi:anti-sigma factor RsiW